jgi:chromate transport protein ChrA
MFKTLHTFKIILAALGFVLMAILVYRILVVHANHIGINILNLIPVFIALIIIIGFELMISRKNKLLNFLLIVYAFLCIFSIYLIYEYNILVEYETWLKQGMQEKSYFTE